MRKGLLLVLMAALVISLGFAVTPANAKDVFVSIGGGPTGGTFNYFANAIAVYVPRVNKDIKMSTEGSGGSGENVKRLNSGDFDFGIAYSVDIGLGAKGQLPKDTNVYDKVRPMGYLYGAPAQLVVRADSPYKAAKDLVGKKVAVGNAGSGAAASAERFFRHIGVWDKFEPQFLGYSAAASAFKDGKIDAFWVLVGYPNASIIEASTQEKIRLLDVGVEAEASGFYDAFAYMPTEIPAGTYPGMDAACKTFQDSTMLCTRDGVDPEVTYEVMKSVWSKAGLAYMVKAHKAAKEMSIENNFKGAPVPLAAGAAKFWKEQGIEIPAKIAPK